MYVSEASLPAKAGWQGTPLGARLSENERQKALRRFRLNWRVVVVTHDARCDTTPAWRYERSLRVRSTSPSPYDELTPPLHRTPSHAGLLACVHDSRRHRERSSGSTGLRTTGCSTPRHYAPRPELETASRDSTIRNSTRDTIHLKG